MPKGCSKKAYCESRNGNPFECSESDGCKLVYGWGGASDDLKEGGGTDKGDKFISGDWGRCTINEDKNLPNTLFNGGFGYGKVCVPRTFTDLIILLVYPPAYVFLYQKRKGFKDIYMIITNFLLTCCFYFPGLIHAMYVKQTGKNTCAGLFSGDKKHSKDKLDSGEDIEVVAGNL